ncbi:hypothetical protein [Streptomyces sp. NPDC001750]|uniref:hypothetical protein n=1 Tax=Streptomyces sp. NPDC001750 TaxID=3364607 RepID=UPI003687A627
MRPLRASSSPPCWSSRSGSAAGFWRTSTPHSSRTPATVFLAFGVAHRYTVWISAPGAVTAGPPPRTLPKVVLVEEDDGGIRAVGTTRSGESVEQGLCRVLSADHPDIASRIGCPAAKDGRAEAPRAEAPGTSENHGGAGAAWSGGTARSGGIAWSGGGAGEAGAPEAFEIFGKGAGSGWRAFGLRT